MMILIPSAVHPNQPTKSHNSRGDGCPNTFFLPDKNILWIIFKENCSSAHFSPYSICVLLSEEIKMLIFLVGEKVYIQKLAKNLKNSKKQN